MPGSTPASLSAEARPIATSQGVTPAAQVTAPAVAAPAAPRQRQRFSPWQEAWRRFRRHRLAVASAIVLGLMVLAIAVGPLLWRVPINEIDFAAKLQGPSWSHPLGTDDLGQDVLARVLYGGRILLSLPQLPLLLLVIYLFRDSLKAVLGPEGGVFVMIVIVIGGLRWMPAARLVRAQFLSLREKEFVEAARALGASKARQVIQHIL